jgi:DNA-binding CsgD family transcriptional regulator
MDARADRPFVGRAHELLEASRALGEAPAGRGAAVLIAGEAGIGKTRLTAELIARARDSGFEVRVGHCIDLVGTELPYRPFVDALGPLAEHADSQLRLFDSVLALLTERARVRPVLLVLEDLHWADVSSLDLVVYLAHSLAEHPIVLVATYRADEPSSAERMRRLSESVRRSGTASLIQLGALGRAELAAVVAAQAGTAPPAALLDAIVARSEGNPFFAEELWAAAGAGNGALPDGLRDILLQRVVRLAPATQGLLRLAAAAGRDVAYALLLAAAGQPAAEVGAALREASEHAVLLADQASGSFRFRHALLAEAVYATLLPGEREETHARIAAALAGNAPAAELAPHWAAAGRAPEAILAFVEAARQTAAASGLAEAHTHLERALALWPQVPTAADLTGLTLAELCTWAAEVASRVGATPRAIELGRRAIELVGDADPRRAALLHVRLGEYLDESGKSFAALAEIERAVALMPQQPPTPQLAWVLGSLAGIKTVVGCWQDSLPVAEQALALARETGAPTAEVRALTVIGSDCAYLGHGNDGLGHLWHALRLAEQVGDALGLERAYGHLTDVLTMLGRPRESAEVGARGLAEVRRYGIHSAVLIGNQIEARLVIGDWDKADELSAQELRLGTAHYTALILRADLARGRGDFDSARAHLDAALPVISEDHPRGLYDVSLAELALWERRWTDAVQAVRDALHAADSPNAGQWRVWFCATGLRAMAELAALARARRDTDATGIWLARAEQFLTAARGAAAEAVAVTPNAAGWLTLAEAEAERARGHPAPESWSAGAAIWDRLERPPLAAYCRWRHAEALVASGASRAEASVPLAEAYAVAGRLGAQPLGRELELLAERARLELRPPDAGPPHRKSSLENALGLTSREVDVLMLVARGYTNREIASALVIGVKTASVHVSHILQKLGAPNRREAAAIAHRLTPLFAQNLTQPVRPVR